VDGTSGRRQGAPFAGSHHCSSSLSARRWTDLRVRFSHGETRPSHEDGSRPGSRSSRSGCAGYRRRVKTRGGLDGKTVIDRSSVSALGSSPIRQREVLLARVLLPLRAKSVDRKGSTTGAASARVRCLLREKADARAARHYRARGMPSQDSLPRRLTPSDGKKGSSAGSTRLSRYEVQCSRGSRDDRSERAPPCPSRAPQGARDTRSARQLLLSANKRRGWRLRQRAFTGDALEISFVARRGEHPGVPDRIGLQGVLLGGIRSLHRDRESVWQRSRSHSRSSRSLRSDREGRVAAMRTSPAGDTPWMGRASQGCSRVRREVPSGRTGRIALSSECSFRIVVCMSRVMASRSSLSGRGARYERRQRVSTRSTAGDGPKRMRQLTLQSFEAKTSDIGRAVTALLIES